MGPEEAFALIGPNGSGKTTTLRVISTLIRPTSGTPAEIKKSTWSRATAIGSRWRPGLRNAYLSRR